MERSEFLNQLEKALKKKLPHNELNEIMEDYNEYFDTGLSEGRQEQELCAEFGEPAAIAAELLNEKRLSSMEDDRSFIRSLAKNRLHIKILSAVLFIACVIWTRMYINVWNWTHAISFFDLLLTFLFPVSIYLFLDIRSIYKGPANNRAYPHSALFSVLPLLIAVIYIAINLPALLPDPFAFRNTGIFISFGIAFLYGLVISLAINLLFAALKRKSLKTSLLFFYSGLFSTILNLEVLFRNLSSPEKVQADLVRCLYPLPFGIILAMMAALFLKKRYFLKAGDECGRTNEKGHS